MANSKYKTRVTVTPKCETFSVVYVLNYQVNRENLEGNFLQSVRPLDNFYQCVSGAIEVQ